MMDAVQRLVAIQEISDLIGRYCMLFDDEDWAGLDELWTDDAAFVVEDQAFEGRAVLMDFLSHCLPPGYRTKHMISRPVVELGDDGTTATARTDVVWIAANFENTILGRYEDELVCDDRGWRFRRSGRTAGAVRPRPAADVRRRQWCQRGDDARRRGTGVER